MYRIEYNGHTILDDQLLDFFPVVSAKYSKETNSAGSLNLQIPEAHPHIDKINQMQLKFKVFKNDKLIFKGQAVKILPDFLNTKTVVVDEKLSVLADSIYRPFDFQGSPTLLFTNLIENHNSQVDIDRRFKVGNVTVKDNNDYIHRSSEEYNTTLSLIQKLRNGLGGYIDIRYEADGDYIDWLEDYPYTNLQKIEFARNLLNLTQELSAEETYSACIPLGKKDDESKEYVTVKSVNDDSDIVFNQDQVNKIGWRFAPSELVTWDDVTRPENLLTKAKDWLNNQGVMLNESLSLTAVDLAYTDTDIDSFDFGKYIHVISKPHKLEKLYLLSKIEVDILHPENTVISLGEKQKTLFDSFEKNKVEIETVKEETKAVESVAKQTVTELHNLTTSFMQTAEEITLSILSNYSTISDLENVKNEIQNMLTVNEQGFNFEFSKLKETLTNLGNEVELQKSYIRLVNGQIILGKADSAVTSVYTNNSLEFRYNGTTVAKFTNEFLEVRNISIENQMRFGRNWAIRPGEYIQGKGYNLNDVWIGGNV